MLDQKTNTIYHTPPYTVSSWSETIQDELALVEERLLDPAPGQHGMLTGTIQNLFNAGGKRVRPAVSLLVARHFEADLNHAVSLAAAVEMLHTATLVHDDLIDGANLRRGTPTLNTLWSADIAVLSGDYMFARAASMIAEVEIVPIMKLFAKTLEIILNGEITQKFSKWQIDLQEYEQRIYAKTAALFVLCTQSASLLANPEPAVLQAMIHYGQSIGTAFQIVDDVLDYTGTADKVGKPIGGDLSQGLFTLPAILYAEKHPGDEDLNALLARQEADPVLVQRLVGKIRKSEVIAASIQEARERIEVGKNALDDLAPSIYLKSLSLLADQVVNRQK
jgi:geranylgeranyl pyrophosphate synthase